MPDKSRLIGPPPSPVAKEHYLYVQEVGSLESTGQHTSTRKNLNSFLFVIVTKGSGIFRIDGESLPVTQGNCIWIDCRKPYSHTSDDRDRWSLSWVHFSGKQAESLYRSFLEMGKGPCFRPDNMQVFTECIRDIYAELQESSALCELNCNYLLTKLAYLVCDCVSREATVLPSSTDRLWAVRDYLEEHLNEDLSLKEIAEEFHFSQFHLVRKYRERFGITIIADLNNKRITKAKELLRTTDLSIETIALTCGFKEAGYFIKVFKKTEDTTPLAFRKSWSTKTR